MKKCLKQRYPSLPIKIEMNQKEVWNKIALPWRCFREKPQKEIANFLKNKKGKILDLGCGSGRNFLKFKGELYALDFSERMIELAKERAQKLKIKSKFFVSEVYNLPFENNFFDYALFASVLHCIKSKAKRKKALKELYRVLKKGGKAIITVWSRKSERIKNKPKESLIPWTVKGKKYMRYYYIYDYPEFKHLLKKVGFEILSLKENKNLIAIVEK